MPSRHSKNQKRSRSVRAGLQFPVSRVLRNLRQGEYSPRTGQGAPIFLAAVLEYLTAEILELAGNATRERHRRRIIPRDVQMAIRNDEELAKLLQHCTIPNGGVIPNIHACLIPYQSKEKMGKESPSPKPSKISKEASPKAKKSLERSASLEKKEPLKKSKSLSNVRTESNTSEASASAAASSSAVRWQYLENGWKYYDKTASDAVELAYQDYLKSPQNFDVRAVKSGRWMYQVDFARMEQTNIEHESHTVRKIRRV